MNSVLEININHFQDNIKEIRKLIKNKIEIMPVIKANAYGTFLNTQIDLLNEFKIVGVANTIEGEKLRKLNFQKDIFVLNQPSISDIPKIIENNLIVGASSMEFIQELGKTEKKVKIHIEIGTGMGRTGINPKRTTEFIKYIENYPNIIIDGIYTHLSSADSDFDYTKKQLDSFDTAVKDLKKIIPNIHYIHSLASNGILNFANYKENYNLVRAGIIMYGYPSDLNHPSKIQLKPVCTLKSKITFLKKVDKDTSISYGRTYKTNKPSIIATVPLGYADGIKRCLSNQGQVIIRGQYASIIGNICMDSFMVDVTAIKDVSLNDEVYIWDNEKITIEDIAEKCKTINYEILTSIGARVPRIFKNEKTN